jgi:phosphomethylpyrimidine synthase
MNARSKVYVEGPRADIKVPFTQVELSGGEAPI